MEYFYVIKGRKPDRIGYNFKQNILLKFSRTNKYLKPADVK